MTLTPSQLNLLRKLVERKQPIFPTKSELRVIHDLVKLGLAEDIRTNLHIVTITPAGIATFESFSQVEAQTKHPTISLGNTQIQEPRDNPNLLKPKSRDNIKYRKRSPSIPEGLGSIPSYRAARDGDKQP